MSAESTDKVFYLWDDFLTSGLTFSQSLKDIKLTIRHSFMAEHNLQWATLPRVTLQYTALSQKSTREVGGCFESRPCIRSTASALPSSFAPSQSNASPALTPVSPCTHQWPLLPVLDIASVNFAGALGLGFNHPTGITNSTLP